MCPARCQLEYAKQTIDILGRERFNFEQVQTFEALASLSTADIKLGIASLATVKEMSFEAGRAFRSYLGMEGVTANQAIPMISLLNNMDDYNNRAAKAFFAVKGMRVDIAQKGMPTLMRLKTTRPKRRKPMPKFPVWISKPCSTVWS